jgi:hypothetical protein
LRVVRETVRYPGVQEREGRNERRLREGEGEAGREPEESAKKIQRQSM